MKSLVLHLGNNYSGHDITDLTRSFYDHYICHVYTFRIKVVSVTYLHCFLLESLQYQPVLLIKDCSLNISLFVSFLLQQKRALCCYFDQRSSENHLTAGLQVFLSYVIFMHNIVNGLLHSDIDIGE